MSLSDTQRLAAIRAAHAAIAPADWRRACDAEGEFVEAVGPMGELLPVARFHPGASADEMRFCADAPQSVGFLLGLVDRAWRKLSASRAASRPADAGPPAGRRTTDDGPASPEMAALRASPDRRGKDYAAEAAMQCGRPGFMLFLHERHGLEKPLTEEKAAQRLRGMLDVTSRAELNQPGRAQDAWRALRAEFKAWRVSARSAPAEAERRWRSDRAANAGEVRSTGPTAGVVR